MTSNTPQDFPGSDGFRSQFELLDEDNSLGGDQFNEDDVVALTVRHPRRRSTFKGDLHELEKIHRRKSHESLSSSGNSFQQAQESILKTFTQSRRQSSKIQSTLLGLARQLSQFDIDSDSDTEGGNNVPGSPKEDRSDDLNLDPKFESRYSPFEMRCLALVAHNHMKPAMKNFVLANKNLLKKFRLTGTNTTMTMLREVFGDDPSVEYGPTCTSGPLGGDAELVAVMCTENLGGCVFFQDPMSAHPHSADIECLNRQANVHNVLMMPNPASAFAIMTTLRIALKEGRAELIPSFFSTLESPSVAEYKKRQKKVVEENK